MQILEASSLPKILPEESLSDETIVREASPYRPLLGTLNDLLTRTDSYLLLVSRTDASALLLPILAGSD